MASLSEGGKRPDGKRPDRGARIQQRSTSTLADFEFHELLGRGSFGKVYRVTRHADGRVYVMKQINVAEMSVPEQLVTMRFKSWPQWTTQPRGA